MTLFKILMFKFSSTTQDNLLTLVLVKSKCKEEEHVFSTYKDIGYLLLFQKGEIKELS